jgi:type IV pilus assembly protein PilM
MPSVGVDISDNTIKFLELVGAGNGRRLGKYGEYAIPQGIVSEGELKNVEKLADELKLIKQKYDLHFIRASLPEEKAYIFHTDVPDTRDERQIRNTIEFKLEEHVPMTPREAIFDYEVLKRHKNGAEHIDVGVVAYPRLTIEKYAGAFHQAGLIPLSFEIEAQAIASAVVKDGDDGTYIIVDFGETRTGLFIMDKCRLAFTSTLEVKGRELTRSITKHLSVDAKEAIKIKNNDGLIRNRDNKDLLKSLMETITVLKEEIEKHYRYWHTRVDDRGKRVDRVEKIILCGGNANLAGLPEYLSGALNVRVERGNVWTNAFSLNDVIPEIDRNQSLSYATAVGLALRESY